MTNPLLKRKKTTNVLEPPPDRVAKISCVLILNREQAHDLTDLLQKARTSSLEPRRFDDTSLGKILTTLTNCGRVG